MGTTRRGIQVACSLWLLWGAACDDGAGGTTAEGTRVVAEAAFDGLDRLRFVVKLEATGDAGGGLEREVIDRTVQVSAEALLGGGYPVPDAVIPPGDGAVYIHVVGLAGDEVVAVGDGAAAVDGEVTIQLVAYDAACDLDGDTYQDCGNLRAGCCESVPADVRPAVEDCVDDPTRLPMAADLKRRSAPDAHNFAPLESDTDYEICDNGVDDDCRGGDQACADVDADEDGVPLGQDCDDSDPTVGAGLYDTPGDGIDQDCNGEDGFGTDADGDGYLVDDPRPEFVDCDDEDPAVHPFAGEIACNEVDEDCREGDLCIDGDLDGDGRVGADDCDDTDAGRYVGRMERCGDGVDQDCDGSDLPCPADDADGDGVGAEEDCADDDPTRAPGLPERCGDGVDQDCDGSDLACPDGADADGDKWLAPADCDDNDAAIGPGQPELCDQRDNDCDGLVDEGNPLTNAAGVDTPPTCFEDVGTCQRGPNVCSRGGYLCLGIGPSEELCDGLDNDCDGLTDMPGEGAEQLADEGVTACGPGNDSGACQDGFLFCADGRLDDCRGAVFPAEEGCDLVDNDCDGRIDEGAVGGALTEACFEGEEAQREQGLCAAGVRRCEDGAFTACEGQILPQEEGCNQLDDDCDGTVDEGIAVACYTFEPPESEGRGNCEAGVRSCVDGMLGPCEGQVGPIAELCDQEDNDCDGRVDQFTEQCFGVEQGLDPALIGVGRCRAGSRVCRQGAWDVCMGEVLPEAEVCDQLDNDCDGTADEDFNFAEDPQNCGVCGRACAAGQACCVGACRAVDTPQNCGGCGVTCVENSDRCQIDGAGARCACGDGPACENGLRCIGGQCLCVDNDDCGPNALCCAGECQPTRFEPVPPGEDGVQQCEACGVACAPGANNCTNRRCQCGENGACEGELVCERDDQGTFQCFGCADNSQCSGDTICCGQVCVRTNPERQCELCGDACDLDKADFCAGENRAADRFCQCGAEPGEHTEENGRTCDAGYFCLRGAQPGDGTCVECRNDDADCAGRAGRGQCVETICRRCDPTNHDGCGPNQLCCNFQCINTSELANGACEACGDACNVDSTNQCTDRTCACGDNAPCDALDETPFCLDRTGECVQCRADADCANRGENTQCVNNVCEVCDPADHAGCGGEQLCCARGDNISCEGTSAVAGQCEACDEGCDPEATDECSSRTCVCGENPPCRGDTPVCDDVNDVCVECLDDADCNGRPGGNQCVENSCVPCDPADHAGCGNNQLCCADGDSFRCEGTQGGPAGQCEACGVACGNSADGCDNRVCECGGAADCADNPTDRFCVDGACDACRNNADCRANELCCNGACEATGGGAQQQCTACGVACNQLTTSQCNGTRQCRCGDNPPCSGNRPACDDNSQQCVECLADAQCEGRQGRTQCVDLSCVECDPANHDGCGENNARPFCEGGACRACQVDAECVVRPGQRDECVGGRCRTCDPGDNAGCDANLPVCDPNTFTCRLCANDDECGNNLECVDGLCRGCDPVADEPCEGATPICDPNNFTCRACANDIECVNRPGGDNQCVDGQCRRCDPAQHDGCNANQLCCNFQCTAANNANCEVCGVACDADATSVCSNRDCRCGNNAECAGQTPFCADGRGVCVNCRNDGDCVAPRGECVADLCERCDPDNNDGCDEDGQVPVCDAVAVNCRACDGDAECRGNPNGEQCLQTGDCKVCDPTDNQGCAGRTPICALNVVPECRGCLNNGECDGEICAQAGGQSGSCGVCDPQDNEGCDAGSDSPICNGPTATCRACANDGECAGNPNGEFCVEGACEACDPEDNGGCDNNSRTPICDRETRTCRACEGDGECVVDPRRQCIPNNGQAGNDVGACRACDPVDDAPCGAGSATPICDAANYACRGCQNNGECAGKAGRTQCFQNRCRLCNPNNDAGCPGARPHCINNGNACVECEDDTHCDGQVCANNQCIACGDDDDCADHPLGNRCVAQVCAPCAVDLDCAGHPAGGTCTDGRCGAGGG